MPAPIKPPKEQIAVAHISAQPSHTVPVPLPLVPLPFMQASTERPIHTLPSKLAETATIPSTFTAIPSAASSPPPLAPKPFKNSSFPI